MIVLSLPSRSSASARSEAPAWVRRSSCVWALVMLEGQYPASGRLNFTFLSQALGQPTLELAGVPWQGVFIPQECCPQVGGAHTGVTEMAS